ncbi:MAG: sulfotransferase [Flavobacteriales bacterium]|nr:sulfotransferase [Flavobacteriales bacterium]
MLHNKSIEEIEKLPLFFIVGYPRSGTTLLQQILDSNPEVIIPLEARFITLLKVKYFKKKKWEEKDLLEFIDDLYLVDKQFTLYWKVEKQILTSQILSIPNEKISFTLLCKLVYLNYKGPYKKDVIKFIGDKNPLNSILIHELIEMFPDTKFIHLIRDYRANILSKKKWFIRSNIFELSITWLKYNIIIEENSKKYPNNFLLLKYENLVENPEKYVKEVTDFLGIEFSKKMLDTHNVLNQSIKSNTDEFLEEKKLTESLHYNLLNPINTSRVESWKNELSEREIRIADYVAGNYATKHGYVPKFKTSSLEFYLKSKFLLVYVSIIIRLVQMYYKSPFWMRALTRNISLFLYRTFGYSNTLNPEIRETVRKDIK